ncbi:MAG: DNA polymerase III subunit beta [Synergistetes bacterium]|nr:DNA polymerase III subunit beta [Synergistota bacterium]MDW8191770.1 DNA polymerase III subunit beta [Synergistota bacterium]
MKVTVERDEFLRGLQLVARAINPKSSITILSGSLIEADENKISLKGTDLKIGVQTDIRPMRVDEVGKAIIPLKNFYDIVRRLPEKPLELETKDNILYLKSHGIEYSFSTYSLEDYPEFPKLEQANLVFRTECDLFSKMIRETIFAGSPHDEIPPYLAGTLFDVREGELRLVSTDAKRLALSKMPVNTYKTGKYLVPITTLEELRRIMTLGKIEMYESKGEVVFKWEDAVLWTRLIDAEFPPYEKVIPTSWITKIVVPAEEIESAMERMSYLVKERGNIIKIEIEKGEMLISGDVPELGSGKERIPVEFDGEPLKIAFNVRFFLDMMRHVDADYFSMAFRGPLEQALITREGKDDFLYILMPVAIPDED